jgi:cyclohexadienyl dehydratase
MMKLIRIYIAAILTLFMVNSSVAADSALNQILSSGVLKAGTTGDFYPFSKRDTATNSYEGYDIDILNELAKDLGVEIEFVSTTWATLVNGITAEKYHVTGSASIKASRMKASGFSDPYTAVVTKAYTTNDKISRFNGWDSINQSNVKVATTLGTSFETQVDNWFTNAEITKVAAPARGFQEVLVGRSDVFVTSNIEGGTLLVKYPQLREIPVEAPRAPVPLAMLLPQADQVWINYVNSWIKIKEAGGFFKATADKYGL